MRPFLVLLVWLASGGAAFAMDYASIADGSAILYDAPSLKAKKVLVASRYLPLEKVVDITGWLKVRDSAGHLAWVEKRALSDRRFVVVTVSEADILRAPDAKSAVVFRAKRQVALEWLENPGTGWLKVRHPDGATGYIKSVEVWGE